MSIDDVMCIFLVADSIVKMRKWKIYLSVC